MSEYLRCKTCGDFSYSDSHVCPPSWLVRDVDYHGDHEGERVYALDAQEAAEKWADENDSGNDYAIVSGSPATVLVRPYDDAAATPQKFIVTGEAVPEYRASPEP